MVPIIFLVVIQLDSVLGNNILQISRVHLTKNIIRTICTVPFVHSSYFRRVLSHPAPSVLVLI